MKSYPHIIEHIGVADEFIIKKKQILRDFSQLNLHTQVE